MKPRDSDYIEPTQKRRRKRKRRCLWTFCCCCFLLLVMIGLTIFFLFPRFPNIEISAPYVTPGQKSILSTRGSVSTASKTNPFQMFMVMSVNLSVSSQNYYDIEVPIVQAIGDVSDYKKMKLPNVVGTANGTNIVIKGMGKSIVRISMIFIYTSTSPVNPANDTTFRAIEETCGFDGSQVRKKFTYNYKLDGVVSIFSLAAMPTFNSSIAFECPIPESEWKSTKQQILASALT